MGCVGCCFEDICLAFLGHPTPRRNLYSTHSRQTSGSALQLPRFHPLFHLLDPDPTPSLFCSLLYSSNFQSNIFPSHINLNIQLNGKIGFKLFDKNSHLSL